MMHTMICMNIEHEAKRFRGFRKRIRIIPFSEKQNTPAAGEFHMDA